MTAIGILKNKKKNKLTIIEVYNNSRYEEVYSSSKLDDVINYLRAKY
jgi:hypothetical protein